MESDTVTESGEKTESKSEVERQLMKEQRKLDKKQRRLLEKMERGAVSASSKEIERDSGEEKEMERQPMKKTELESEKGMERGRVSASSKETEREHQAVIKEITSLEIEHKDLLAALTPTFSGWKGIKSQTPSWRSVGKVDMASVQTDKMDSSKIEPTSTAARGDEKELAEHFDFILEDMENLGHRMLSMLHSLKKSNDTKSTATICSYKARELCCTTSRLDKVISKEFPIEQDQERNPRLEEELIEEEPGQEQKLFMGFLNLFNKYYQFPEHYENELWLLVAEEDAQEEDPEDVGKKYEELGKKEEEEQAHMDESSMEYLKKRMDIEQQEFAYVRTFWQNVWGSKSGRCGGFGDTTTLSPMHFTHYTPGVIPSPAAVAASTLQVYSIKIRVLKDLKWPLRVYGEVAARDTVDRNRNILFSRSRFEYQELTREDCSLCLTGPSRAIVAMDPVDFEVELHTVEGVDKDRALMSLRHRVEDGTTFSLSNDCCVAEFNLQQLDRSLQATILGVRVTKGRWPFKCGCRVVCSWSPLAATEVISTTYRRVVLLDFCGKGMPKGSDNYLHLSRKVVSVESQGTLRVAIEAYGKSRHRITQKGHVDFPVEDCQISTRECSVGDVTVEVAVAWSLLVNEKADLLLG